MNYIQFTSDNGKNLSVPVNTIDTYDQAYQRGKDMAKAKHTIAWLLANIEQIALTHPQSEAGKACRQLVTNYDTNQKSGEIK